MVSRFDVFLINLDPVPSSDAKNTRPGVVLSPDEINRNLDHVIIAPLSSNGAGYPTRVPVEFLNSPRFIVLDQIKTVDKDRLAKKIGEIDESIRKETLSILAELFAK